MVAQRHLQQLLHGSLNDLAVLQNMGIYSSLSNQGLRSWV
jgi:hypothetical protein